MKILIVTGNDFEDLELIYPLHRLKEEGYEVKIASKETDVIKGKHEYSIKPDLSFETVKSEEYDALVIPGGKAPESIRLNGKAVEIVKHFFEREKPVATICHGPQILISADVLKGRKGTSVITIREDVVNAGVNFEDKEVVVDRNWVSSRHPGDLYIWMKKFIEILKKL
ncbi:MAG: type 1 glutamine amidotransferase [Kosmotoga sp.]|nr:MAG: type 1 glutamine amidotransferase [Kosmotoga sp.]